MGRRANNRGAAEASYLGDKSADQRRLSVDRGTDNSRMAADLNTKMISQVVTAVISQPLFVEELVAKLVAKITECVVDRIQESLALNENLVEGPRKDIEPKDIKIAAAKANTSTRTDKLEQYQRRNSLSGFSGLKKRQMNQQIKLR